MQYPARANDNFVFRAEILSRVKGDKQFQAAIRNIIKDDILFWINTFCWIYDAKGDIYEKLGFSNQNMAFLTFDYQDEYIMKVIDHIQNGKDLLTEKSRDMGASWIILTIFLWFFLFGGVGNDFLLGSRKEEYVDKQGIMSALYPKLRYQLYRQPSWLMPLGFNRRAHDNYMRLINPETKSFIQGEANNDVFGSGGRAKAVLYDEFAKWKNTDKMAWQSTSDVTNCRLALSSAWGRNNQFFRLRSGKAGKIEIVRLHWKLHPLKDNLWYEEQKKRRPPEDVAAEIDIDYTASISDKAYSSFKYDIHCAKPYPQHNTDLPISLECDFNISPMSWALSHENEGEDDYFDEIVVNETRTEYAAIKFRDAYKNHKNKELIIYGDATGRSRSANSKETNYQIIERILGIEDNPKNGWQIVKQVKSANPSVVGRLNATNKRLSDWATKDNKNWIHINPVKCPTIVDSFEQTQRKGDGIDKTGNVEHITDAIGYKQEYKYPIRNDYVGYREL